MKDLVIRPMLAGDFLTLMDQNAEHYPEYMALSDEMKLAIAQLRANNGTAQSYFYKGQLVAVGGITSIGIGEAWLVAKPDILVENKKSLFKETKREIKDAQEQGLWMIVANAKISSNFLEHLGFKQKTAYIKIGVK